MKAIYSLFIAVLVVTAITSCNSISYKKTKSGLLYKIFPSDSKDSLVKNGNWIKFHFEQKLNDDSVLGTSYGKMPAYEQIRDMPNADYNPVEVFPLLKKGDSVVTVLLIDSLISKGQIQQLPPFLKKGDRLVFTIKVLDVFRNDSLYQVDAKAEYEKDMPRQMKEREEQMAKERQRMKEEQEKMFADMEKSGEAASQRKVVEDYLSSKKITAQKTEHGAYVLVREQGAGPKALAGKYLTVKYTGRRLATDSVFESNIYPDLQIGMGNVVPGWDEGLQLFNEGGKGTIYIPGYMGYGKNPRPGGPIKTDDALIFDVEIIKVSDKPEQPQLQQ